jgi:hypothetical protein
MNVYEKNVRERERERERRNSQFAHDIFCEIFFPSAVNRDIKSIYGALVLTFFIFCQNITSINHREEEHGHNCHTKTRQQQVKNIGRYVTFSRIQICVASWQH